MTDAGVRSFADHLYLNMKCFSVFREVLSFYIFIFSALYVLLKYASLFFLAKTPYFYAFEENNFVLKTMHVFFTLDKL